MSNPPEVPTDWEMWDDIEESLEKKKKNRFFPVLLGLPFLLLLSGFIGYWLAPKNDNPILSMLEKQTDTIYINSSKTIVDTIVKTEYITQWKYRNPDQNKLLYAQLQNTSDLNSLLTNKIATLDAKLDDYRLAFSESKVKDNPKYQHLDYFNNQNTIQPFEDNFNDRDQIQNLTLSPLLKAEDLLYSHPKIIILHDDLWLENMLKNKKPNSFFKHIVPDYINLGISVDFPGLPFTENLSPSLESGLGLQSEFLFSQKFSIITGIRKRNSQNKTSDINIALTYPQPTINSEENFKDLKVKSSYLDIPFSFKYKVFKHRQNDIYLTGGVLLTKRTQTEYLYEYVRNTSEIYYEEKSQGGNWMIGSSIFGVGYEADTWKNTSAFVETHARYNFKNDSELVHGLGIRFGMFYKI